MRLLHKGRAWLKANLGRSRMEREMEAELRFHVEARTDDLIKKGVPAIEAGRRARIEFGGMDHAKQECREAKRVGIAQGALQDVRFGWRMLRKNPGFAVVAVLTLAVGIGGASAVFSVVDRILFRPLPYPQDERLVSFGLLAPIEAHEFMLGAGYVDFRKDPRPFEAVTSMAPGTSGCDLTEENPLRLNCAMVEQTFLPTLGIEPLLGRNFRPEEDRPQAPRAAIISYALWRGRFGGDASVLQKTVSLDGAATRIVGVLPATFEMPTQTDADLLLPQALDELEQRRSSPGRVLRTFARLKPGTTLAQAAQALEPWLEKAAAGAPAPFRHEIRLSVRTLRERQTEDVRLASWLLLASVLAFLLLASANVANLVLARATGRKREAAMRAALGASRTRLLRQSLTESLLLGGLGTVAGCGIAYLLLRLFVSMAPQGIPRLEQARIDVRVAVFAMLANLLSVLVFGAVPAWQSGRTIAVGGREVQPAGRSVFRPMIVSAQIAVSLILLMAASLLMRSLWNLGNVRLGMHTESVLTEQISLGAYRYPTREKQLAFFSDLEKKMRQMPGAIAVAISDSLPPSGQMRSTILAAIEVAGRPDWSQGTGGSVGWRAVTPGYFAALDVGLARGRGFAESDRLPDRHAIILNETLAKRLFAGGDPIGQQLRLFREAGPWRTVVGVAQDVKNDGLTERPGPEFYLPWKNDPAESPAAGYVVVRTQMNAKGVAEWMRTEVRSFDATLPVRIETLTQRVGKLRARPKFNAMLLASFAAMGLLLAAIGIYGVVRYLVAERTQEIGVRMALGATRGTILSLMLGGMARWTLAGAAVGLAGGWMAARLLESLLFEVRAHETMVYAAALALLITVAFLAAWFPARKATRVDPMVALRCA